MRPRLWISSLSLGAIALLALAQALWSLLATHAIDAVDSGFSLVRIAAHPAGLRFALCLALLSLSVTLALGLGRAILRARLSPWWGLALYLVAACGVQAGIDTVNYNVELDLAEPAIRSRWGLWVIEAVALSQSPDGPCIEAVRYGDRKLLLGERSLRLGLLPLPFDDVGLRDALATIECPQPTPRRVRINSVYELLPRAGALSRIDLADIETRKVLLSLPAAAVQDVKRELARGAVAADKSAAPPRWPIALLLFVEGEPEPFVAHPVGVDRIRLNPHAPWSPAVADEQGRLDPTVVEVALGEALHEAIDRLLPPKIERAKEHRARPAALESLRKYQSAD